MTVPPAKESVKLWRVPALPELKLLRATYVTQTFARHAHEDFAVGVIEEGALGFYYRGENVAAARGAVNLAFPGEAHTGRALVEEGWTYRMFYVEAEALRKIASQAAGKEAGMPFFGAGVLHDAHLARIIRDLHATMEDESVSTLEKESRFVFMLSLLIRRHAETPPALHRIGRERGAVLRTRRYIDEHCTEDITIGLLAAIANLSPFHFIRVFAGEAGMPPHAYLNQARVRRAGDFIRCGWSIAAAACEAGFTDQSHLARHFKRILGVTPGQYAKAHRTR